MKKILYITALSLISGFCHANESADLSSLLMRMKEIEVRISLLERDVSELRLSKASSVPLNQANLPSAQVLIWAGKTLQEVYTYNYKNFPQVLTSIRHHFTQPGYDSYMKALDESKNMQVVQDKKLAVSGKAGKGTVVKESLNNGIYTWEVQIPIEVTYEGVGESIKQNIVANLEIVRVPNADSPAGIAIHSITAVSADQAKAAPQGTGATAAPSNPADATKK